MPRKTLLSLFIDDYIDELKRALDLLDRRDIEKVISILLTAYRKEKNVFIIGNGGSASNASHMACDFSKGTLKRVYDEKEKRFRVYSLTDNAAILTAYGNDLSFEDIFTQQLRNLIKRGDVVIVLSGSGNSENLVRAIRYAKRCKARTIGILGFKDGGRLGTMVEVSILVHSKHYGPSEDIQLVLNHIITSWMSRVKHNYKKNTKNSAVPYKT